MLRGAAVCNPRPRCGRGGETAGAPSHRRGDGQTLRRSARPGFAGALFAWRAHVLTELEERRQWSEEKKNAKVAALIAKLPAYFESDYAAVSPDGHGHFPILVAKCYWLWSESVVIEPADLQKISAPVLVMAGDHDFTSIEESTEMFRGIPKGQLMIVPGTGHGTFTDRPDLVNLAVEEFLDGPEHPAH